MDLDQSKRDILKEVANIGAGNAATAFSGMIGQEINMTVPKVELIDIQDLPAITGDEEEYIACIMINFSGEISGKILLVVDMENVERMLKLIFSTDELPEKSMQHSALNELGNILSGAYLKAINDFTDLDLEQSVPAMAYDMAGAVLSSSVIDYSQTEDFILLLETEFIAGAEKLELFYFFIPEKDSLDFLFERLVGGNFA
ncbi:chemotaxis protein CheC [Halanaerobium saccharolyticum]|uniref:Chemotaxis protein CheC n=1 Tax=Halanaerobium saccharolyticum TaxID=43595 RepID=A0A4R7YNP1_9FIRM|nr:chemotaxis protein CheC [Halanaerobium saccharolyticum]RAK04917.1 chemotaxis protein CheC [Halanaerobium saccharolyticum]TDV98289.1 chemotaxis protein CheC [Halanaerobium saccharolyticum]TDX51227.1 chemotaxis protein CheC [Halanaerobium saccharolyticum]